MDANDVQDTDYMIITVAWQNGRPVYNIGEMDPYSAVTVLKHVIDAIEEDLPAAWAWDKPMINREDLPGVDD